MVVPIGNIERLEFRQRPRLRGRCFRGPVWRNLILSLLNKISINSGTIGRHSGGVFNDWILYRYTRCFGSGVRAQAISSGCPNVSRDISYISLPVSVACTPLCLFLYLPYIYIDPLELHSKIKSFIQFFTLQSLQLWARIALPTEQSNYYLIQEVTTSTTFASISSFFKYQTTSLQPSRCRRPLPQPVYSRHAADALYRNQSTAITLQTTSTTTIKPDRRTNWRIKNVKIRFRQDANLSKF